MQEAVGESAEQVQSYDDQMAIPEDGHQWKKYGQKFIKNIKRIRCYFRCRRPGCRAKKRVEWPPSDAGNLRVVYEGAHEHAAPAPSSTPSEQEPSPSAANQYNLVTQVLEARHERP